MVAPSVEPEGLGPSGLFKDSHTRGHWNHKKSSFYFLVERNEG